MSRKRVVLYLRVSTSEQTIRNQCRELHAVAKRHGWNVVATYEDAGISGAKGRDKRPGFDHLMTAVCETRDRHGGSVVGRQVGAIPHGPAFLPERVVCEGR
jgi:DNA invertase Pin-like site-specific DNA recombinase